MRRFRTIAEVDGDAITVTTEWSGMPPRHRAAAMAGLAQHLGCTHAPEPMEKAAKPMGEKPDPRYSELLVLIEHARADWDAWGARLTRRVLELLDAGRLLPMTPANEAVLRALFDDHRVAMVLDLAGPGTTGRERLAKLADAGLINREIVARGGYVELAFRLGKGLDALKQHELPVPTREPNLAAVLRKALEPQLTESDRHAIAWSQKNAASLIGASIDKATGVAWRTLSLDEVGSIRRAVATHLEDGGRGNLRQELHEAIQGTKIQNDLDRIVRTELAFAHNYGAYLKLKEQARALGEDDPQVYRVASRNACQHCLRIWGPPTAPRIYRLSEIEQWEAQGGNIGVPASDWGPVIGPMHPNCACSPLAYTRPEMEAAIRSAVDAVFKTFGKF